MEQIVLIKRNGTKINLQSREPFCAVRSAVQNISLMGDDTVTLSIVSSEYLTFSKGDKIVIDGCDYTVRTVVDTDKHSDEYYSYEVTFYGVMYDLMKTMYRNTDAAGRSTTSEFDLTLPLNEFIKVLIYNVNRDYPGVWVFDEESCPKTDPKTMSFSVQNCLQVLQTVCQEFKYEFQITQNGTQRTIHIGKFGKVVTPPNNSQFFEWGKGGGLYNLKEQKVDDKAVITRLWVEGSTDNIRTDYRGFSSRLQLPYPPRLNARDHKLYNGIEVKAGTVMIGIDDDTKRYLEDANMRDALGSDEDSVKFDEIAPRRKGSVTAVDEKDGCSFFDSSMDFDLAEKDKNGTKWLIDGVTAKINFITGKLAGQQFEIKADKGYDHSQKKFTIIPFTDERGQTFPTEDSDAFVIQVGDQYNITDINLPKSYEDYAEEDLWFAGMDEFLQRKQARAQYSLTLDRLFLMENLPEDTNARLFNVGDYVPVKDTRFSIEKNIRINKIQRNLMLQQDYQLTLSDTNTISIINQTVIDVIEHDQIINNNRLRDPNKARRGWRTTEELRSMIYDTDGYFDTENIKPNSIDTNMLAVGSKSQQFILTGVVLMPNAGGNANKFYATAGVLTHLAFDKKDMSQDLQNALGAETFVSWNITGMEYTMPDKEGYYLFAKCSKTNTVGTWYLTKKKLMVENQDDPANYYFLVGIVGSLEEGYTYRDFTSTYGFTRINGNTITTGRIITSDKECYLDLDGNKFRIGDSTSSIDWNVTKDKQITLKNVQLVSQSGDTSHIGVYRGTYNPGYVYYEGDEVSFTSNGETCTYRYINKQPSAGNKPTNAVFWSVIAKGQTGETGNSIFYTYHDSQSEPAAPTGSGNKDGWHTNSTEHVIWMSIKTAKTIADGTWGTPYRVRGADGTSIKILGTKGSISELPIVGNANGDAYIIGENLYIWDGASWKNVGQFKGSDGKSSYLHKKYSDDGGKTFTAGNGEVPGRWLGLLVSLDSKESDNPGDYTWSDTQGIQGIPGEPGEDGRTTYLHIKYSDNGGLSFTANNGEEPGSYIGQYTDFDLLDSNDPRDYKWSLIKGDPGSSGSDPDSVDFYEYRYAKNGSTQKAPDLNVSLLDPPGWTKAQPKLGTLEYLWETRAKKSGISDKTLFYVPVDLEEEGTDIARDFSGNGYDAFLDEGASIVEVFCTGYSVYGIDLSENADCRIPYDLPYGEAFTLCFWMRSDQSKFTWMINGKYGREYIEREVAITPGEWGKYAFRFSDKTITVFKDGSQIFIGAIAEDIVGFSMYDGNIFGSSIQFAQIRMMRGALSEGDIAKVLNVTADVLVEKWSTPIRVSPYDGKDAVSVSNVDVEYAKNKSTSVAPTSGWNTVAPKWEDGSYIWSRTKVVLSNKETSYTSPVCITGGKGATGLPGDPGDPGRGVSSIIEQYYHSTSTQVLRDGSWSGSRPTWKDGWYIWTRSQISYTDGTVRYTDPICVSGSKGDKGDPGDKGDKGENPVFVYRGVYDSTKTYYGNKDRLDCVKYNNQYYIARIDVLGGSFSNALPTNTNYWNQFGAQLESIATNLLLAEGANIGDWFMSGGKIVSTLGTGSKVILDATMAEILLDCDREGGAFSMNDFGSKVTLSARQGIVKVEAKEPPSYSTGTTYMSPNGIFANLAGTNGMPYSSGYTHRGAVVGLGFANVNKSEWQINSDQTIVAGVYGRAYNNGTAPSFGGFFYDLFAGGLILARRCVTGGRGQNTTEYLDNGDTMIIGYTSGIATVYLPASPKEGQVIFVKQWWAGLMRFRTRGGQYIYDDTTVNDYYDFSESYGGMFVFTVGYIGDERKECWLVNRWRF